MGACPQRVPLILGQREAAVGQFGEVALVQEEPAGDRAFARTGHQRITHVGGEASPAWRVERQLKAADAGLPEGDRDADAGVQQHVVVREVVHPPVEDRAFDSPLTADGHGQTRFQEMPARGPDGDAQDRV